MTGNQQQQQQQAQAALSKFLSYVLRHAPESIGIELDGAGWTDVDPLLRQLTLHGKSIDRATLGELVVTNNKKRFAFDESGTRIRASQGHSVAIDAGYEALTPPDILFHGTASRFLEPILTEGLKRLSRQHVHLSVNTETAIQVGSRHGKPVVLQVDAAGMHRDGFLFYRSENGVWLTEAVPPQYLATVSDTKSS